MPRRCWPGGSKLDTAHTGAAYSEKGVSGMGHPREQVLVYVTSPPHRFIEVPSKEAAAGGYSYTQKIHAGITVETATPCCSFIPVLLGILEQEQW